MKARQLSTLVGLQLLVAASVFAQGVGSSGTVAGTVLDATGAVVPKVNVTAVETDKGTRYTTTTDSTGIYRFASLPAATYTVTAQISGFDTQMQTGVVV